MRPEKYDYKLQEFLSNDFIIFMEVSILSCIDIKAQTMDSIFCFIGDSSSLINQFRFVV